MLEIYGKGYVIEHCISLFAKYQEEKSYRIYVTDCLQAIAENTTHFAGINGVVDYGKTMKARWIDIVEPKPEETRTAEQIIRNLRNGLRKLAKEGDAG